MPVILPRLEYDVAGQQKDLLDTLTPDERIHLDHLSRSRTDPAAQVARAKEVLAVANGESFEVATSTTFRENPVFAGCISPVAPDPHDEKA